MDNRATRAPQVPLDTSADRTPGSLPNWVQRIGSPRLLTEPFPAAAKIYILAMIACGSAIFVMSLHGALAADRFEWIYLALITVLASSFAVRIPLVGGKVQGVFVTLGDILVFTAILLFGPEVGVLIAVVEGTTVQFRQNIRTVYKKLFNLSELALVSFVVGRLFYALIGQPAPLDPGAPGDLMKLMIVVGVSGLAYFFLNTGTIALAMSLTLRRPFVKIWTENFVWTSITHIVGSFLGALTFLWSGQILYVFLVAGPLVGLIFYAYKMNRDRIVRSQQHLDEVEALLAAKTQAERNLQGANAQLEVRVTERTKQLRVANRELEKEVRDRVRAEGQLATEKERLTVTLKSIGEGVIAADIHGRVSMVNEMAEALTQWTQDDAVGRPLSEVFTIVDRKTENPLASPATQALRTGRVVTSRDKGTVLIARGGPERAIAHSAAPIRDEKGRVLGVVVTFRDVTYEQKIEQELWKTQKLESLGILAGGIAHDFNNILSGILLNSQLASSGAAQGASTEQYMAGIEEATLRAAKLTQQLSTFAKGGAPIKKTASIEEVIRESASFVLRGSAVLCGFEFPEDLWSVEIDEGQISQVIHNLVINADQAMPDGGTIVICAENVEVSQEGPVGSLTSGSYVKVSVTDAGVGISRENLARVFDPYFTTKDAGNGLGLASTYSIIKRHDGHISAQSKVAHGTSFTFYIPASKAAIAEAGAEDHRISSGAGRILVMDDEPMIRECLGALLEGLGYEVGFAADGAEAIASYKEAASENNRYDVLIMDLTIPGGMGGREAIGRIRKLNPNVRAIVSSGYSEACEMADYEAYGFCGVLTKPYTIQDVGRTLEEILSESSNVVQFPSAVSA